MATPALDHAVRVVPGDSQNLDDVLRVMNAAFGDRYGEAWTRSQCAGILPMTGVALWLARDVDNGEIIGFSLSRRVEDEAELLLIAVAPMQHRRGVGSRLLDEFLNEAQAHGVRRVHLEVRDGNPAANMYRAAGFTPIGRRRNYYRGSSGDRFDAVTYARSV